MFLQQTGDQLWKTELFQMVKVTCGIENVPNVPNTKSRCKASGGIIRHELETSCFHNAGQGLFSFSSFFLLFVFLLPTISLAKVRKRCNQ